MNYWLMKSEPSVFSIDDLARARGQVTSWEGVRNYQVRNMIRDEMKPGDLGFFYHSSCDEPGIAGIVEVAGSAYPDASAWNPRSEYHDAKSTEKKPVWYTIDVRLKQRFKQPVTLEALRGHADNTLDGMLLLRKGNRLSVTPVERRHWQFILTLAR